MRQFDFPKILLGRNRQFVEGRCHALQIGLGDCLTQSVRRNRVALLLARVSGRLQGSLILALKSRHVLSPLRKRSFHFIGRGPGSIRWLRGSFQVSIQLRRLFDNRRIGGRVVRFEIVRHVGAIDSLHKRLEASGYVGL